MSVLQDLYDSEINFSIETFWDGGFDVKLGDERNGYKADWNCNKFIGAVNFLKAHAILHYPDSDFAEKYRTCNE